MRSNNNISSLNSLNSLLAKTVKQLRLSKKLSQEELASLASVDRTYISGIERARRNITISTLERLIPHLADSSTSFFESLCKQIESSKIESSPARLEPSIPVGFGPTPQAKVSAGRVARPV